MHIGVVSHNVIKGDGQGRVNLEIVKQALIQGHKVTVFSSTIEEELLEHPSFFWKKVKADFIPIILLKAQYFALISTFLIKKERRNIDILLVNGFTTWVKSDFNAVHFVHGKWIKSPIHPIRNKVNIHSVYQLIYSYFNSKLEKYALGRTRTIITVSEKVKRELIESSIVKTESKIKTIFNGVDIYEFCPETRRKERTEETVTALFAGDIRTNRKNLDSVLKAIRNVPNISLKIAGNIEGSPYPKMAQELDVSNRVDFIGFNKNVNSIMNSVDLFIFPSRYEACSLVVLEALASGLPVITTIESGLAEIINNPKGHGGIVLENPEDVETLTKAIATLVGDQLIRDRMSENARGIAEENTWTNMANLYIKLFEKMYFKDNQKEHIELDMQEDDKSVHYES